MFVVKLCKFGNEVVKLLHCDWPSGFGALRVGGLNGYDDAGIPEEIPNDVMFECCDWVAETRLEGRPPNIAEAAPNEAAETVED